MTTYLWNIKTLKVDLSVDTDILSVTNYLFGGTVTRDRFNVLNHLCNFRFEYTKSDPVPFGISKDIQTIIDERAQELISSTEEKIGILWSGGVDSTCVVSAFIRNGIAKDKLVICCTEEGPRQSPYYYEFLKRNGYEIRYTDNLPELIGNLPECGCLTSGACADQLFMHIIHRYDLSLYHLPWIEGVKRLFEKRYCPLSKESLEYFKAIWEDYAKIFDVELRYFCDFVWLYNFAIRYGFVRDREAMMIAKLKNTKKYQAFFDSFDFQCWSVANVPNLNRYHQVLDRYHYKKELKDCTFSVVKDRTCYELGKHVSRPYPYEKISEIVAYDTEGIKVFNVPTGNEYWRAGKYLGNLYRKLPVL